MKGIENDKKIKKRKIYAPGACRRLAIARYQYVLPSDTLFRVISYFFFKKDETNYSI
jgi:hypothetical protein